MCGLPAGDDPLECHHVFGGALRGKSERFGLTVYLHGSECHRDGKYAVHQFKETRENLQEIAQKAAMEAYGWTENQWIGIFYKNHIKEDEDDK